VIRALMPLKDSVRELRPGTVPPDLRHSRGRHRHGNVARSAPLEIASPGIACRDARYALFRLDCSWLRNASSPVPTSTEGPPSATCYGIAAASWATSLTRFVILRRRVVRREKAPNQ
jgi:hypothetical protein